MRPVVMYHYVRNPKGTEFPNLYSRSKEQFSFQVNHLEAEYGFCALDNLDASKRSTSLMTFDDGIKDHFENVMPLLKRHGIKAAFFVSSLPLQKPVLLDVHKLQLLLGSQPHGDLFESLKRTIGERKLRTYQDSVDTSKDVAARMEKQDILLFKRLLQRDLEMPLRSEVVRALFGEYFPDDEARIAKEFYMTLSDLREMKDAGMVIGNHTVSHPWLGHLSDEEAQLEIDDCENFLVGEGLMDEDFKTIAYPYGDSSLGVKTHLRNNGYQFAFTTAPKIWDDSKFDRLSIPRLDTNDVPFS